jgi:hypothetical protein
VGRGRIDARSGRHPGIPGRAAEAAVVTAIPPSASSAQVPGMKGKSCGQESPAGSLRLMHDAPGAASQSYRLRLSAGVSISARTRAESGSREDRAEGVGDFTVPQRAARHHPGLHAHTVVMSRVLRDQ